MNTPLNPAAPIAGNTTPIGQNNRRSGKRNSQQKDRNKSDDAQDSAEGETPDTALQKTDDQDHQIDCLA